MGGTLCLSVCHVEVDQSDLSLLATSQVILLAQFGGVVKAQTLFSDLDSQKTLLLNLVPHLMLLTRLLDC